MSVFFHTFKVGIPLLLLCIALLWVMFGSNVIDNSYGLERHQDIYSPRLASTSANYKSIRDLTEHLTYLTFGYSHCVDVCPITLGQMASMAKQLPEDVRFIFVSVDVKRDNISRLSSFLKPYGDNLIGWQLEKKELVEFASQFGSGLDIQNDKQLGHGSGIHLINGNGVLVKTYPYLNLQLNKIVSDYTNFKKTELN